MAWYYGTYSCGHDGRVQIYGPVKDRQWKADREFSKMCPDCYEEYLQKQREEETKRAMELAKEMELPELRGTEKQVAWAVKIRQALIEKFDEYLKEGEEVIKRRFKISLPELMQIRDFILTNRTSASYYIELRYMTLFDIIEMEKKEALKSEWQKQFEKEMEQIKQESIVYPENTKDKAVAEIQVRPDRVAVRYPKNERFRLIVKELGYDWDRNSSSWVKTIKETTGSAEERAAELGNKLLNAGFPVCILDPEIRQKAINGEYDPECRRWICRRDDKLAINWTDGSDLYKKAITLPSAKWSRPSVLVRVEYYQEAEEFAELYGFRFTEAARRLIEEHKQQKETALVVKPAPEKKVEHKDGLEDILQSEASVLDDLKD